MVHPKKKQVTVVVQHNPKWSDKLYLNHLPDLCLHKIMGMLDIQTMGHVECWSKGWKEWLKVLYHECYLQHLKDEEQHTQEQADCDDVL